MEMLMSRVSCLLLVVLPWCVLCLQERFFPIDGMIRDLGGQNAEPEVPFRITWVERKDNGDSERIKVVFEGSVTPNIFIGEHDSQPVHPDQPGVVQFEVAKDDFATIYFVLPDRYVKASFAPREASDSMDIPRLRFDILQGQDIKFKPGEDVQLDFTFDVEGETGHVIPRDMKYQILVQSSTQENVVDRYNSLYIKRHPDISPVSLGMVTSGGSKIHQYGTLVLNSAAGDLEGVVDITVGISFNCTTNCLMHRLEDTLSLKIYQEGHEGPFMKDFLGFVHDDFRMNSSHFLCGVNSSICDITCEVVGEGLVGVEIIKTSSSDKPLQSVSQVIGSWGRSFLHIPDVSFEDAGNFSCRAWTQTKEITEQLTLGVAQPVVIDRDASVVTQLENGSFLFTCLAEGIPAPNVTLYDFASGRPIPANQTHVTHTSQSQTRADAIVNGPRPLSDWGSYEIYCYAVNADSDSAITAFADMMTFYA